MTQIIGSGEGRFSLVPGKAVALKVDLELLFKAGGTIVLRHRDSAEFSVGPFSATVDYYDILGVPVNATQDQIKTYFFLNNASAALRAASAAVLAVTVF